MDAYSLGFAGVKQEILRLGGETLVVDMTLSWGQNCSETSLWFHVPPTKDPHAAIIEVLNSFKQVLVDLDMQTKLPTKAGCVVTPISSAEDRFSKKIFVYSETELSKDKNSLILQASRNGVHVELRSGAYLRSLQNDWPLKRPSLPTQVVIMMVGKSAP